MRADRDRALVAAIYAKVAVYPRYGYRLVANELRIDGWHVNAKRVYRLWRREGLKVARKARKQRSKGGSAKQREEPSFASYERRVGDGLHPRLDGFGRFVENAGDRR